MEAEKIKKDHITTAKQKKILDTKKQHPELSTREIATACDTDHAYVSRVLQKYKINYKSLKDYQDNKAAILDGFGLRLISSVSDEDIQKASLQQKIVAAGILLDKADIARSGDKSTQPLVIINRIAINQPSECAKIVDVECATSG